MPSQTNMHCSDIYVEKQTNNAVYKYPWQELFILLWGDVRVK